MVSLSNHELAQALTPGGGVARHLANAHVAFNVLGVLLFIGFVPWIARALERLLPSSKTLQPPAPEPLVAA